MTEAGLGSLFARFPPGWSEATYQGHRYGVTRTVSVDGRIQKFYAEELGGTDVISANLYPRDQLRPCEMPAEKVLAFISGATGTAPPTSDRTP